MNLEQKEKRERLWSLLGSLPPHTRPVDGKITRERESDSYILQEIILDAGGLEPVSGYFIKPRNLSGPAPAILYHHHHGGNYHVGARELIEGWAGLQNPPYAQEFASRGWVALCMDMWNFGKRHTRTESSLFKEMLWRGQVLWGMMVYDAVKALDYLCSRSEVDTNWIGAFGMSMGSTMAWWLAALDERIKVCVDLCCLTDFDALIEAGGLDKHGLYYYVPGLLNHFSTADINALIAPRPHLSLAGARDALTPPEGLDRIDRHLQKVYKEFEVPEAWKLYREDTGHQETPTMRKQILAWLERWLV